MMPADPMDQIIIVVILVFAGAVGWEYARLAYQIIRRRRRG